MLELYDAKVSHEDANLKFLRSLPSVWNVVATMIRGQPGLDKLEFDYLYNNLKVYEHEWKGVSISSSQNIAFLSTEIKGSTLKQSTADPETIPKGYTQTALSKVQTAPNCASHSDEIICSFFAQQASMPTTHDDEDLLQIDEDAMEEIDIRWQNEYAWGDKYEQMEYDLKMRDLKLEEKQFKVDEVLADISRPRGLSIPGPIQSQPQPQQPSQATDPKDKGKGILVEEPKKKKLTLQQIRALETTNDEEVARKIQAEWDAEEERKRFEELKKAKPKTTL
ncbi:hypothetical protein Tco_1533428, partial [Tanacetum coccineum]